MEFIRRNSDYALRSLSYLAKFPKGQRLTIKIIAKRQNLPLVFLRKIFQKLSQSRLVRSQRGSKGGFYLLKDPSQISLRRILESVQGQISLSDCLFADDSCSRSKTCRIRKGLADIQKELTSLLDKYTLEDFSDEKVYA